MTSAFYVSIGGDLATRQGAPLSLSDAASLASLYLDELDAALSASDPAAARQAASRLRDLVGAAWTCALWRRASGPA